jgi:hypothetical protein
VNLSLLEATVCENLKQIERLREKAGCFALLSNVPKETLAPEPLSLFFE